MRKFLLMIVAGFALAGCGGGDSDDAFRPPPDGGLPPGPPPVATQLTVQASAASMPSDGTGSVTITAFARDASNVLVANVPVTFTATSGGLSGSTATTGANGEATATLGTAGDSVPRTITVTAASGTLTANVAVQVLSGGGNTPLSVSLGSGTGAGFQAGVLALTSANLSSGGSTSIQAVLQQSDGNLYAQAASINFSSPCAAQGQASITPNPAPTSTGIANVTYAATGCSGTDVITATATAGGATTTATGTVTIAPGVIGSIVFISATPTNIALRGTGNAGHPETSTVIFRVLDQAGGPRVGTTVNFALNTTVGGIGVSPLTAQSDANGNVQTVVQGGTVATSVRVTATVQNVTPILATQSSQLTVTTGIPDQNSFSLAVQCQNVEAWNRDGVVVPVTARLSDRFNNPVPDGTAVTLQAEGGSIVSQCITAGGIGACSVNWTSSNPRPPASPATPADPGDTRLGRATILATAIGEESFTDTNGNGSFDAGEVWDDLPERFMDENENDSRDSFEPIYDFNNNSVYDPLDNLFNGVLCLDSAHCNTNATTTGISATNLIIMSHGAAATFDPLPGTDLPVSGIPISAPGAGAVTIVIGDLNDNPLPTGTTVTATVSGTGISVGSPNSYDVGCLTEPDDYTFTIIKSSTAGSGLLTVRIESPAGLVVVRSWNIL
jgi:hypothetical protein